MMKRIEKTDRSNPYVSPPIQPFAGKKEQMKLSKEKTVQKEGELLAPLRVHSEEDEEVKISNETIASRPKYFLGCGESMNKILHEKALKNSEAKTQLDKEMKKELDKGIKISSVRTKKMKRA